MKEARLLILLDHSISINILFQLSQWISISLQPMLLSHTQMFTIQCFSLHGTPPTFVLINKQSTETPNYRLQEHKIP